MNRLDRKPRSAPRYRRGEFSTRRRLSDLLDDDHVGGLLTRIRVVGCLIGAAADIDPVQISAAGWLVEELAEEARARLKAAIEGPPSGGTAISTGRRL